MTLLFIDGFDDGLTNTKWTSTTAVTIVSGGRTLNRARLQDNSDSVLYKTVDNADFHATFITGFAFVTSLSFGAYNAANICNFYNNALSTLQVSMGIDANNSIVFRKGDGTLLGTSATNTITPGTFSYIEIYLTLGESPDGVITLMVDGVQKSLIPNPPGPAVPSLTGIDTHNGGPSLLETVSFNATSGPAGSEFWVDDFYLCNGAGAINNDFLGDCSVLTRYPDGNGNYSQGVNTAMTSTNNFSYVDENPPDAVDYVSFATSGNKDTYSFQDIPAGTVYGVQQAMYAAKTDAGSRTMRNIQRIGGVDYVSADKALGVSPTYAAKIDMLQVSPATTGLWTFTEVNGAEFGTEARP